MTDDKTYTDINAETINRWIEDGWRWGMPISHEVFQNAQNGHWELLLTPSKPVPREWFLPYLRENALMGTRILGLASGGGQQMPVFAALKADCTVLDYADAQIATEKLVAEREGYRIQIIKADMTRRLPFDDNRFDMIFHPVSNCYAEDVRHIWNECFRVLKSGGVLLAGMDNGIRFAFDNPDTVPFTVTNKLPFNPLKDKKLYEKHVETDGIQFSHNLEEQIGGQLKAGFILTHLYEDREGGIKLSEYLPLYYATRAVKP